LACPDFSIGALSPVSYQTCRRCLERSVADVLKERTSGRTSIHQRELNILASYSLALDGQLIVGVKVAVVVRWIPRVPLRYGTQVARPAPCGGPVAEVQPIR
jgi:hypothetical protein